MYENSKVNCYDSNNLVKKRNDKEHKLSDLDIGNPLGDGKFGHVYLAKTVKDGFVCALKIMFKSQLSRHKLEHQFHREIDIMVNLNHPNILKLYDWFHDADRIYLILEYAWYGQMFTILQKKGRFNENESATFLHQLCDALIYCHKRGVIHRDIKPENLLISHDFDLKLADFGWSVHTFNKKRQTMCGTLDYLPPEIVESRAYDERIDHWMAGILLYEMLTGSPPFERQTKDETYKAIRSGQLIFKSNYVKDEAKDLIRKILKLSPIERLSLKEIQNHSWILQHKSKTELKKTLIYANKE